MQNNKINNMNTKGLVTYDWLQKNLGFLHDMVEQWKKS